MPGVYLRGKTWWGRFQLAGIEHRRSLDTGRRDVAEARLDKWLRDEQARQPADRDGDPYEMPTGVLGHVYAIGYGDKVKIGWTGNEPSYRLTQLQPTYPEVLTLFGASPGYMRDEKALHARFDEYRIRGEWFLWRGLVADWLAAGCPVDFAAGAPSQSAASLPSTLTGAR